MPYTGAFALWPSGPDLESSTPALWPPIDRKLSQLGLTVQSEQERKEKIPQPAANERWTVRCPPLNLTWTWDGLRWLTWDDQPVTYPAYWYDGTDNTPLLVGDGGTLKATYQRRGHWCDMTMTTVLGTGGNVGAGGGEKWYWYLSYPPVDMYQTGRARIRLADTREWSASVGMLNNTRIYVAASGNRLNKDLFGTDFWTSTAGNQVLMQMTYQMKV